MEELIDNFSGVSCGEYYEWKKLQEAILIYSGKIKLNEIQLKRFLEDSLMRYKRLLREVGVFFTAEEAVLYNRIELYVSSGKLSLQETMEIDRKLFELLDM